MMFNPNIPQELEDLIMALLAKNPQDRPSLKSVESILAELQASHVHQSVRTFHGLSVSDTRHDSAESYRSPTEILRSSFDSNQTTLIVTETVS